MSHHPNNQQMVQQHQQQQGVRQQPYGIANQPNINHMMQHQPIMVRMPMEDPNAHYQMTQQPNVQQQGVQQPQMVRQSTFGMMHPHQAPVMMRMPMGDEATHYQQQFREVMQNLPPNIQNQINSEKDPDRKKQMINSVMMKQQQQMYEHQMQGGMGMRMPMNAPTQRLPMSQPSGMVYPGQQIIMQQPVPAQIQRIPSQGSFGQPSTHSHSQQAQPVQMYIQQNQMGANAMRMPMQQPMPISQPYQQQSQQIQMASHHQQQQQQSTFQPIQKSNSVGNSLSQQKGMPTPNAQAHLSMDTHQNMSAMNAQPTRKVPAVGGQLAVSSEEHAMTGAETAIKTQNTSEQQPRSAGTPLSQQQNESENPEYKSLLERLRTYHSDVKRLLDRLNIDNPGEMKLKSSLINVIQVMEGTRKGGPVTRELLRKLLSNVQTVLEQYNISRHLLSASRKLATLTSNIRESSSHTIDPLFIDPWKDVRHLQIKVPDCVSQSQQESMKVKKEVNSNATNRNDEPPVKRSLLTTISESFAPNNKNGADDEKRVEIVCMDGSILVLNPTLCLALHEAKQHGFSIEFDGDRVPISKNTSTLHIRLKFQSTKNLKNGIASSLDLLLPVDYPKAPIQILNEPSDTNFGADLDEFMEQVDSGMVNAHSLKEILKAWLEYNSSDRI